MIPHFRQKLVRDLAWAVFGPPLIRFDGMPGVADGSLRLSPGRCSWLSQLDREPAGLQDFVGDPPRRLGLYFERLWQYFLHSDPAVELVGHNIPVNEAGRTVGEFDLIYLCKQRRRFVHLELAVKFYLGFDGLWLGPNPNDRLDRKLARLLQHQVRLARHPAARAVLDALGVDAVTPAIALKGSLFQPTVRPQPWPDGYKAGAAPPRWFHLGEFRRRAPAGNYAVLPRLAWLSPAGSEARRVSAEALCDRLQEQFDAGAAAQLVAQLGDAGREVRRCFIAPDSWPGAVH